MRVKFWGVRGSIPSPGPATSRFGGNTSCVELRCGGERLIFDAGSGIRELGESLTAPVRRWSPADRPARGPPPPRGRGARRGRAPAR